VESAKHVTIANSWRCNEQPKFKTWRPCMRSLVRPVGAGRQSQAGHATCSRTAMESKRRDPLMMKTICTDSKRLMRLMSGVCGSHNAFGKPLFHRILVPVT
jgi:hypothetical protein